MHTVRQILKTKGDATYSVPPDGTVLDAVREMARRGVGALLVMDGRELVGMISERDYARKVILEGRGSHQTLVRQVMSQPVVTISPDTPAEVGLALITTKRIRHLPVVESGRVIGIVSIGDLVAAVIDDQQHLIEQLERYVTGAGALSSPHWMP
jgi:CBS domain-containing protein